MDAASLVAVDVTAMLALRRADALLDGGLVGKAVFVPAGLSGTVAVALQLAKRLGADVMDRAVDFTARNPVAESGARSVAFVFDTTGLPLVYMPLVRKDELVLSIAWVPPGSATDLSNGSKEAKLQALQPLKTACVGKRAMDVQDAVVRMWARTRYGVSYEYQKTEPTSTDVVDLGVLVSRGKSGSLWGGPLRWRTLRG